MFQFPLDLYEKLLQVLLLHCLPLGWLSGALIESDSSVHTCGTFALWQGSGGFHGDIHRIYILVG